MSDAERLRQHEFRAILRRLADVQSELTSLVGWVGEVRSEVEVGSQEESALADVVDYLASSKAVAGLAANGLREVLRDSMDEAQPSCAGQP